MKILISVATELEALELRRIQTSSHDLSVVVTGVGMVATAYNLTKALAVSEYDLAINCGIAGSFDRSLAVGEVVFVEQDIFSELGAEDDMDFLSLTAMGLTGEDSVSSKTFEKFPALNKFRKVRGITVNTVHGSDSSIEKIINRLHPEVETMEGAAFYFVCEREKILSIQLRAISNYVERRNRDAWNIPLAMRSIYESLKVFLDEI